jgi:hypothetical protein
MPLYQQKGTWGFGMSADVLHPQNAGLDFWLDPGGNVLGLAKVPRDFIERLKR